MILARPRTRFRTILILRIAAILLVTVTLIGINIWVRAVRQISSITDRIISSTATLIDQRLNGLLLGAESAGRLMAGVTQDWAAAPLPEKRIEPARHLIQLLLANPGFSSASLSLDGSGTMIRVQRQNDSTIIIQFSTKTAQGWVREDFAPFGAAFRLVARERWTYDPRTERHYRRCRDQQELIWSDTYVIRSPSGLDAPGITCATPVFSTDGQFIGVVSIDFTLSDLSRFLQTVKAGDNGFAFLAEQAEGGVRLIAHPDSSRILVTEGGQQRIATLATIQDPVLTAIVSGMVDLPDEPGEIAQFQARAGGAKWLIGMQRIGLERAPPWLVSVAIPESDYTEGLNQQALVLLAITGIALAGAILGSIVLADRVTEPLSALVAETERIREFELDARPLPKTPIKEISDLASSMEQMKTGLRSFQKLVPGEYARYLLKSGQEARLGGERRHMSISFADLIGFTTLSETVPPEVLSQILGEYLDALAKEILNTQGTVDKFNGDDVMAFWGAPAHVEDHALAACRTALASQRALAMAYPEWEARGIPRLRVSWGISTGDVIVGNVGSRERMNYTVIGDTVNLASRLQGINRAYGTEVLISAATVREAGGEFVTRLVDWVVPLGKEQPVEVFELVGEASSIDPIVQEAMEYHRRGLALHRERRFAEAAQEFRSVLAMRPSDGPAKVMVARSERYLAKPPDSDWDGSHRIGSK